MMGDIYFREIPERPQKSRRLLFLSDGEGRAGKNIALKVQTNSPVL